MGHKSLPDLRQVILIACYRHFEVIQDHGTSMHLNFGSPALFPNLVELCEPWLNIRGFRHVGFIGKINEAGATRIGTPMASNWHSIPEVIDLVFEWFKKGDGLDAAGLTGAANLCYLQGH